MIQRGRSSKPFAHRPGSARSSCLFMHGSALISQPFTPASESLPLPALPALAMTGFAAILAETLRNYPLQSSLFRVTNLSVKAFPLTVASWFQTLTRILMSDDHNAAIATIRRFYKAEAGYLTPGGGDFDALSATLDPECVLYQPASLPYGGEWRRPEGFVRWLEAFSAQWSSVEVRDSEFYPSGEVVFSRSHVYAVARASGQPVDWPLLQFFRVRASKILELRPFYWDTAKLLPASRR